MHMVSMRNRFQVFLDACQCDSPEALHKCTEVEVSCVSRSSRQSGLYNVQGISA